MSKKFKKGQKVWVFRFAMSSLTIRCEEMVYIEYDEVLETHICRTQRGIDALCEYVFPTKQECIDYITNSIKVIPYEDTTSN